MAINKNILQYSSIIFTVGLLMLITSAMGVKCSSECEEHKKKNQGNHTWMSIMLTISSIMVVGSLVGFYFGFAGKTVKVDNKEAAPIVDVLKSASKLAI